MQSDSAGRPWSRLFSAAGWLPVLLVFSMLSCPATAKDQAKEKSVLILISFSAGDTWNTLGFLKSRLRTLVPWSVNFYVEWMEGQRFDDEGYEKAVAETLRHKYGRQKLDLVMVEAYPALQFAVRHRDELFSGVPIVFWDVSAARLQAQEVWPGVTGVTEVAPFGATIDLALHLHPDTSTVAIIAGNSSPDRFWLALVHAELLRYRDQVKEVDLVALPTTQLLERIATLPRQTVVLFQQLREDSVQPAMGPYDVLSWVGQRLPTYCIFPEICLNHGGIGGVTLVVNDQAERAVELARRVLLGERPDSIPIVDESTNQVLVDWRQLRQWKIKESALPAGSVVLYREPTLWERGRKYALVAIVVIVAQGLWIFALLWQRTRKHRAEAVLGESEERFRLVANTAPVLIWMCGADKLCSYFNQRWLDFTGRELEEELGNGWLEGVHPEDLQRCLETFTEIFNNRQQFTLEYRLRRHDGEYRWVLDIGVPRFNSDGSFAGYIGSVIDVTDRKEAEQAIATVSGRLIEAQDEERRRIARELHDDISQRFALLSIELQRLTDALPKSSVELRKGTKQLLKRTSEISSDIHALSHRLHSSKLDYLGVVAAMAGFCSEFAAQQGVEIDFEHTDVPRSLPQDISLCLFRVVQEGLLNAVKYSGVRHFQAELRGEPGAILLIIRDSGAGFDPDETMKNGGLGLISMRERVSLVKGTISIASKPLAGTEIMVRIPVAQAIATSATQMSFSVAKGVYGTSEDKDLAS